MGLTTTATRQPEISPGCLPGPGLELSSFIGLMSQLAPNSCTCLYVLQLGLMAQFLFAQDDGLKGLKLILVLAQMCTSSTIAPLVLADKLTGLDRVKRGESG
ncbi:conserved hypothetical protein [Ricinus communis]|uniref:Uncharacterized protein n=1 Tax=Ricinus communis TaxID=3988 RepID=B9S832_RICCO|nr:conserved hypothetical protein [Ricinus communis]